MSATFSFLSSPDSVLTTSLAAKVRAQQRQAFQAEPNMAAKTCSKPGVHACMQAC